MPPHPHAQTIPSPVTTPIQSIIPPCQPFPPLPDPLVQQMCLRVWKMKHWHKHDRIIYSLMLIPNDLTWELINFIFWLWLQFRNIQAQFVHASFKLARFAGKSPPPLRQRTTPSFPKHFSPKNQKILSTRPIIENQKLE